MPEKEDEVNSYETFSEQFGVEEMCMDLEGYEPMLAPAWLQCALEVDGDGDGDDDDNDQFLGENILALVNFRSRAYLPWPDLPVTHTGFSHPPPFRLLY